MKYRKSILNRWISKIPFGVADSGSPIMDELNFNRMLCLERKRSHRTGDPFVLLVIDVGAVSDKVRIAELCAAIQAETRDTDLCGWYRTSGAIGVIFTALQEPDRNSVQKAIAAKMNRAMGSVMDPGEFRKVEMSYHFFPEKSEMKDASDFKSDEKLYPDLIDTGASKAFYYGLKRTIDIAGSFCFLLLSSPVLLLIACMIKLSSPGPVLFRQRRIGQFGKEFDCLKFRTMYTDCDHEIHRKYVQKLIEGTDTSQNVYKIVNDPRITPVGRLLRKTSLDELPQFVNVLSGDMSLVGPRPPIPYEISCYRQWHRRRIIETKPGITGLWQVYGRSRTSFDEMVRLDIRYIEQQSIWLDLKVLLMTPWAVVTCLGAY